MAIRETSGRLERTLQAIVSSPPRATVTVGSSIVALLFVMEALSQRWPEVRLLRYVVPFLPPFIITRAARRIAERRSAHEFIRDAVPYVFVAFPTAPTAEAMQAVRPHVMSDSASKHTGLSFDELFESEPLPRQLLVDPAARGRLVATLLKGLEEQGRGEVTGKPIWLRRRGEVIPYVLSSALLRTEKGLKWQTTMMQVAEGLHMGSAPG